jgi:hypothetical protein
MRGFAFLTYLLACTTFLCAQDFKSSTNLSTDSDTALWYNLKDSYAKKYELKSIASDTNQIAFSFWCYGNLIYISKNNSSFYGEVTKYVKELNDKESPNRTFKKSFHLSKEIIDKIFNLIDSSKITAIPSDKYIKNWKQGFDGIEYIIEFKSANNYSFKTFWIPKSQENVTEASTIIKFTDKLYSLCKMKYLSNIFDKNIPFDSWTYEGSGTGITRIVNKRKKY